MATNREKMSEKLFAGSVLLGEVVFSNPSFPAGLLLPYLGTANLHPRTEDRVH